MLLSILRRENKEFLFSLKEELQASTTKEFWEVSERGTNINYLEPAQREHIQTFYEWFSNTMTPDELVNFMRSAGLWAIFKV